MARLVGRALFLLACYKFEVAAFSWQNENTLTVSTSFGSYALYNELAALSSSVAAEEGPSATLGIVSPTETPGSIVRITLTTFTIVPSAPTIFPTPVLPLEPTRSSTSVPTTIRVILTTTPSRTVRPVLRGVETTTIPTSIALTPTNRPGPGPAG